MIRRLRLLIQALSVTAATQSSGGAPAVTYYTTYLSMGQY